MEVRKSEYRGRAVFAPSVGAAFQETPIRFRVRSLADDSGWIVVRPR